MAKIKNYKLPKGKTVKLLGKLTTHGFNFITWDPENSATNGNSEDECDVILNRMKGDSSSPDVTFIKEDHATVTETLDPCIYRVMTKNKKYAIATWAQLSTLNDAAQEYNFTYKT